MNEYLIELQSLFSNKVLNSVGIERDFLVFLQQGNVTGALDMMSDRTKEVNQALKEYNTETHKVMNRRDKPRKNDAPYKVEKLPRNLPCYINNVELFFLLGAPVLYKKKNGDDRSFEVFNDFIKSNRIHSLHRRFKKIAGSETEASLVYHLYRDGNNIACKPFIAARSTGYELRQLFDQFGTLCASAYGFKVKQGNATIQRWTIYTENIIFECEQGKLGWAIEPRANIIKKIPLIYAHQDKSWAGTERRIDRLEMIDSKTGDTNNYFADPVAYATADVINLMGKKKDDIGTLLQFTGENSKFGYITPPQDSTARQEERSNLKSSIFFDSFTPDLSYESIKGLGSLSGEAIENSLILGFIKRANNIDIYEDLFDREINIIKAVLSAMHPELDFNSLEIEMEFQSPFDKQKTEKWDKVISLYASGLITLETAIQMLSVSPSPEKEVEELKSAGKREKKEKIS